MNSLFKNEIISIEYNEKEDLVYSSWHRCQFAEDFVRAIKDYKIIFNKILPSKILWNDSDFSLFITPELQKWTYDFLDKPASALNIDFQVSHILPQQLLISLPIIEMFPDGKTYYQPRFFAHEQEALNYLINQPSSNNDLKLSVNKQENKNRAQIVLDINLDMLPEYLIEFQKLLKSRYFLVENTQKYSLLSTREKEILKLITKNCSNKEIADKLILSLETVKTHRKNIIRKLQCKSISELMSYTVFG
jgi:DNA-binding CsgD family transcriptional regulator